ncbi:MAG: AI-2E family transporter [Ardenticatenaceae bacterium]|nr:AI-2E family transporter [Ardenticatenaceae bacterium]
MTRLFRQPRFLLFVVVSALILAVLWAARGALFPFALGLVVAYLLIPLVNHVQAAMPAGFRSHGLARPVAIIVVYLAGLALVGIFLGFLAPLVVSQIGLLVNAAPALYQEGQALVNQALEAWNAYLTADLQRMIQEYAQRLGPGILSAVQRGTLRTIGIVTNTVSWVLGLLVIPFWLFFVLNDSDKAKRGALKLLPPPLRPDAEALRIIVDRVLGAYIRGQLILAFSVGLMATLGLMVLGVEFALLLGIAAGAFEIFPFIGPILGAIPAVIVALLQDPGLALRVVVLFAAIQQIENVLLVPKINGAAVALHPALIMVVLVVGQQLFGLAGMLIAVPLTAVLRDVVNYLYLRVGDEGARPAEALAAVGYGDSVTPIVREVPAATTETAPAVTSYRLEG